MNIVITSLFYSLGKRHQSKTLSSLTIHEKNLTAEVNLNNKGNKEDDLRGSPITRYHRKKQQQQGEQISKIVSEKNVRFSLNKKHRWEMVEQLLQQKHANNSSPSYEHGCCSKSPITRRQKFMKRKVYNKICSNFYQKRKDEERDIVIEDQYIISITTDRYRYKTIKFSYF